MRTAALGDLTIKATTWDPRRHPDLEINYIDLGAVDNETKEIAHPAFVKGSDAPSRARQLVSSGDVLVSTVRPNLNAVAVVPESLDGAIASTGFAVLRPDRELDKRYLFHWVRSPRFISSMVSKATGASYPAVSERIVKESLIPIPPLEEQRRTAGILDQADAIRAKRRQVLAHLDTLTQSIFYDMFGDVGDDRWNRIPLGDLVARIDNGTSPNCETRPAKPHEWGVLKLGAVTYGQFQPEENKAFLGNVASMVANEVQAGDVLMTRKNTRELVGAVALVDEVRPHLLLPDLIFRLHLDLDRIDPRYFQALMMNPRKRSAVRDLASGSAASMPNISKARLSKLLIELPPLDLQRRFAARAKQINAQRALVQRALDVDNELFASLQDRAFRGEL